MFDTVLVANRGEIALRVMRACKELGLRTVAVYSEADRDALHVAYADDAYLIGGAAASESYLRGDAIVAAAQRAGAQAIHPGYGFLAENAAFASACEDAGLVFIGPPASAMERMGGKTAARREALAAGVPVVPGTTEPIDDLGQMASVAADLGYPVAIKAVAGGGGRGFRVVASPAALDEAFASARREALAGFGNADVYLERYMPDPRHIEIQILADVYGNVIHLGERECSVQRRHQKLIEECPSPVLGAALRAEMGAAAVRLAAAVGYVGVGTMEFIFQDGAWFFLEMNTRIQVEHPVTEMITGMDLVKWQLRIASGEKLTVRQQDVEIRGHAIECRVTAEDPEKDFMPSSGEVEYYLPPGGPGVRVDSHLYPGYALPTAYDSLLAKVICWGKDRNEALERTRRALGEMVVTGVKTSIPFTQAMMDDGPFIEGTISTRYVPELLSRMRESKLA